MNLLHVCGHDIDERKIIGIGPLMAEGEAGQVAQIYKYRRFYFNLHLLHYSLRIESNSVAIDNMIDTEGENQKYLQEFKRLYEVTKDHIIRNYE
jgi:hypothetical protein